MFAWELQFRCQCEIEGLEDDFGTRTADQISLGEYYEHEDCPNPLKTSSHGVVYPNG